MSSISHNHASTHSDKKNSPALPLSLTLLIISLCVPVELSFYFFGLRLTMTRLLLLLLTPVLVAKAARKLTSRRYRFVLSDLFVPLAGVWMIVAPTAVNGFADALHHAGPDVLEFCVAYMATRILMSKHGHALAFADQLCQAVAVVAMLGLLDTLTGYYATHEFFSRMTGAKSPVGDFWGDAHRLGFLRASGPIEHPILFALMCVIAVLIASSVPVRNRLLVITTCSLGTLFSFSAGPIQCLLLGGCLKAYDRIFRAYSFRWFALAVAGLSAISAAFLISNSPTGFIVSHFTFSSDSGYYRIWTWDMVTDAVSHSPWLGLGVGAEPEDVGNSIDSLWLVLAMRSGVPGVALVALSIMGAASLRTSGPAIDLGPDERKLGTILGIILFLTLFIAFIVHLWGATWILAGLLAGVRAHLGELGHLRRASSTLILRGGFADVNGFPGASTAGSERNQRPYLAGNHAVSDSGLRRAGYRAG